MSKFGGIPVGDSQPVAKGSRFGGVPVAAQEAPQVIPQSVGRTVLDQGLQGATYGFADEVTDRLGAGIASLATDESYENLLKEARGMSKERLQQQMKQNPEYAIPANIAGALLTGGAGLSTKAGGTVANSLRTGGTALRIAKGAAAGATSGALYGAGAAEEGKRLEGGGEGAFYGGLIGGAIPAVGAAGGAVKNAILPKVTDPEVAALAQKALAENIPLRRSQIGDGRFAKAVASTTNSIPFSGAKGFADKQQVAFNKAVLSKAGIEAGKATPEVLQGARDVFTKKFADVIGKTTVQIDDDILDKFSTIEQEATKRLGADGQKLVKSYLDDVLNSGGQIDGKTYQNTRSALGKMAKSKMNSDPFIGGLLKDMQTALDDAAFKSLPESGQKAWERVRKQYGAYKTIQNAMNSTSAGAATGNISPGALASATKSGNPNYALGAGELNDLARIGGAFVRDNIPNSGTAERLSAYGGLVGLPGAIIGGAPGAAGSAAAGVGLARGFNALDTSQRLVKGALKNASQ